MKNYNDIRIIYQVRNELLAGNASIGRFLLIYAVLLHITNDIDSLSMYGKFADVLSIMMYDMNFTIGAMYINASTNVLEKLLITTSPKIPILINVPALTTKK